MRNTEGTLLRVIRLEQGTLFSETVGAVMSILDWEARGHPVSIGAAISLRARQVLAEAKNKVTDKARGVGAAAGKGPGAQSSKPAKGGGKDKDGVRRPQTPTKRRSRSPARQAAPAKGSGKGETQWSGQWTSHWRGGRGARR